MGIQPLDPTQVADWQKKITIRLYKEHQDLYTYTGLVPAFCVPCQQQIDGFYAYTGGRYGQVGEVTCPTCETIMYVTDMDAGPDVLYMCLGGYRNPFINDLKKFDEQVPQIVLDMEILYQMHEYVFEEIRKRTGYDVFQHEDKEPVELSTIIEEICAKLGQNPDDLPTTPITVDERLPTMPPVITRWLHLLQQIGVPRVTDRDMLQAWYGEYRMAKRNRRLQNETTPPPAPAKPRSFTDRIKSLFGK